jgi:alkanesulfonate monooxygenase SsuD/methylene tetrahydromethanopterin reductase-like flavin-dependent oxidoreductase (luciferase family)
MRGGTAGRRPTAQMRSTPRSEAPDSPRRGSHQRDPSTAYELERYQRIYRTGRLVGTPERLVERLRVAEQMGVTYVIRNFADAACGPARMDLFANAVTAAFA